VLVWVSLALFAVSCALSVRWMLVRVDSLGRVHGFPTIGVAASAGLAVLCAVPVVRTELFERRLDAAASELAGARVRVHCQTTGESFVHAGSEWGWVPTGSNGLPEKHTVLSKVACQHLASWIRSDHRSPTEKEVMAVHVLTHEAMHMKGMLNEAEAECAAMQRDARTAVLLGADQVDAVALAERYWQTIYPRVESGYSSPACVPGGELDERLPWPPWE